MKTKLSFAVLGALLALMPGCMDRTELVDQVNDHEIVAGLDYKDFEAAATEATQAILSSGKLRNLTKDPRTYVVALGHVEDATPLQIDTDLVTARITEALLGDERFEVTAAVADKGSNQDQMIATARTLRTNAEFNQDFVPQQGKLASPDFSLFGKIIARDVRRDNGGHQYEYYFQLRLTNLSTGTLVMSKETKIIKRTGEKSHTW